MKHTPRSKRPHSIKRSFEWCARVARALEYVASPGDPAAYPDQAAMTAVLTKLRDAEQKGKV
jgi:hypothetical protein